MHIKHLMFQFFQGLAHIHKMGIAHRDIKPDNILISVDADSNKDNLKICDFGSAKYLPSHNTNLATHETIAAKSSVTYISTRYFRSPELLYGNQYYGTEIDLWAAGCVLAELFTKPAIKKAQSGKQMLTLENYTLFRGDSNIHQLALIINLKGTPTNEDLKKINPLYN